MGREMITGRWEEGKCGKLSKRPTFSFLPKVAVLYTPCMSRRVRFTYENGVLKPAEPLSWLKEHESVEMEVPIPSPERYPFRNWNLPPLDPKVADEMQRVIEECFEQVEDDDDVPSF